MELKFEKWHGNKNDFILIWFQHDQVTFDSLRRNAAHLCQRDGSGIGADGILVLHTKSPRDLVPFKLSIINSDGSLAQTCGNGIRCAALSVLQHHLDAVPKVDIPDAISLALESSTAHCQFLGPLETSGRRMPLVAVDMGDVQLDGENPDFNQVRNFVNRTAKDLEMPALVKDWSLVSLSNRHLVFQLESVSRDLIRKIGPALQISDLWDGINVHIVSSKELAENDKRSTGLNLGSPIQELFEVYVWERGAGETQACGSGAVAVGIHAYSKALSSRKSWLGIDMPGGRLFVKQDDPDGTTTLAGPAHHVFDGSVFI